MSIPTAKRELRRNIAGSKQFSTNRSPHEPTVTFPPEVYRIRGQNQLVIGVVGTISSRHKGNQIVHDLALLLRKRDPRARVVVGGELKPECSARNVKVSGKYRREDMPGILNRLRIDVVLLPSTIPETFSYATQEIISLECPIVCLDFGRPGRTGKKKYDYLRIVSGVTAESALATIEELMSEIAPPGK